jgi:molybdopterin synthase sulfur carrier subunit
MADVFIPTMLQSLSGGVKRVDIEAANVRQVVDKLEELFPGIKERLVEEGQIRPNVSVAVDGEIARMGILEKISQNSEVHFVPAIGGGSVLPVNVQA